jgi:hypothetical protein
MAIVGCERSSTSRYLHRTPSWRRAGGLDCLRPPRRLWEEAADFHVRPLDRFAIFLHAVLCDVTQTLQELLDRSYDWF